VLLRSSGRSSFAHIMGVVVNDTSSDTRSLPKRDGELAEKPATMPPHENRINTATREVLIDRTVNRLFRAQTRPVQV